MGFAWFRLGRGLGDPDPARHQPVELRAVPSALVIARALQRYGAYVGDQSGGGVTLKVENTVAEGRGNLWNGVLDPRSLSAIPLTAYEVVQRGWGAP